MSLVRVYIAMSIDGFIAGPNNDLSWLPGADPQQDPPPEWIDPGDGALGYDEFIKDVGALLMGRGTYEVASSFGVPWPSGDRPILVATTRPLEPDAPSMVRAVRGSIQEMIGIAKEAARGRDVYLDGGDLIRQAAAGGLIDDFTITVAPVAIGAGHPLFGGLTGYYPLEIVSHHSHAHGMLQIRARPKGD